MKFVIKATMITSLLLSCGLVTSCSTDPSSQDLRSPCVSIDHPDSPCIRKSPIANPVGGRATV